MGPYQARAVVVPTLRFSFWPEVLYGKFCMNMDFNLDANPSFQAKCLEKATVKFYNFKVEKAWFRKNTFVPDNSFHIKEQVTCYNLFI
jgi:hypothetical protein